MVSISKNWIVHSAFNACEIETFTPSVELSQLSPDPLRCLSSQMREEMARIMQHDDMQGVSGPTTCLTAQIPTQHEKLKQIRGLKCPCRAF